MRRFVLAGIAALVFAFSAGPAFAVPPHDHWLTTGVPEAPGSRVAGRFRASISPPTEG